MGNRFFAGRNRYVVIGLFICAGILSLGNFDKPPSGFTGAPGESTCMECHSLPSSGQNGNILINGFPTTINANQTYTLTVTVANPNGVAELAGFQSVILDSNNENAGIMTNPSSGSTLVTLGSRMYHEHFPAQPFGAINVVAWTVDWTAPEGSGLLTMYAAGNVANGNGSSSGDLILTTSKSGTLMTPLQVEIIDAEDVTCFGLMNGSITADATFGTPGYTYTWSNGGSGAMIVGLGPGDYTVTVTDMAGATATAFVEIFEPPLFEITSATVTPVSCNGGNDGSIEIFLSGGTPPYNPVQSFPGLSAGTYQIMVPDANGCVVSEDYTVTEPPLLTIEITVIIEPGCAGEATGLISIDGMGGTGQIDYNWSNGSTGSTIQNLAAGTYTVTATDFNGCTAIEVIPLDDPAPLTLGLLSLQHVSCFGAADGEISVEASGGSGFLLYEWSNGSLSATVSGLAPGIYTVTVTDENGCLETAQYEIIEPQLVTAVISGTTSLPCFGDNFGVLSVLASGGIPLYSYAWSNGATSDTIIGLFAGAYTVTVTDNNGCSAISGMTISGPAQILPNVTTTGESVPGAMDGTATASPTGGTGSYSFMWSTGDTTATITGLSIGTYSVTITDDNSCFATQTVLVTGINCTLDITVGSSDVQCFGEASGAAQVSSVGAIGPVNILWSTGDTTPVVENLVAGTYLVSVIDSAGCPAIQDFVISQPGALSVVCTVFGETMEGANDGMVSCTVSGGVTPYEFNWSNGDTTQNITGLSPGTYLLTITDANGCSITETAVVYMFNCALSITVSTSDVLCKGDSSGIAALTVSGGTGPFQINWSNGDTGLSIDSVVAGTYSVTVTDVVNCSAETLFEINEPDEIVVTVDSVIAANQDGGGAIFITLTGGTPPYSPVWTKSGETVSEDEDLLDVQPGDYALEVLDAHGCSLAFGMLTITVTTGIIDAQDVSRVNLWPNPATDYFWLTARDNVLIEGQIITSAGMVIKEISFDEFPTNEDMVRINIEDLSRGLYYLQIISGTGSQIIPFIKI